jgi:hypothetical protein
MTYTLRVRNLIHVGKIYFTVLFGSLNPSARWAPFLFKHVRQLTQQPSARPPCARALTNQGGCHHKCAHFLSEPEPSLYVPRGQGRHAKSLGSGTPCPWMQRQSESEI